MSEHTPTSTPLRNYPACARAPLCARACVDAFGCSLNPDVFLDSKFNGACVSACACVRACDHIILGAVVPAALVPPSSTCTNYKL